MINLKIAIVDDESEQRSNLIAHIAESLGEDAAEYSVIQFGSGEDFLAAAAAQSFDIVFMDIYMGGANGVDTAQVFRGLDGDCPLVFTTTSTDHALDAYKLRAMQYLIKPYESTEVDRIFEELRRRLPPVGKSLELKTGRQSVKIRQQDILWADNFQHQVHVHMDDGSTVSSRMNFGEFCEMLNGDSRFFVCGRGVLVNLAKVSDFDGRCFHIDAAQLPVSRQFVEKAHRAFADWLFINNRR